jgi:hypothetical protein
MTERGLATLDMARRYFHLFVNRAAYTVQSHKPDTGGKYYYYRPKGQQRLGFDTIIKHLNGEITVGLYAINPRTQRSKWVAIDADYDAAFEHLVKLQWELRKDGVHSALERSRRGAHLWLFAAAPLLASDCRLYIYTPKKLMPSGFFQEDAHATFDARTPSTRCRRADRGISQRRPRAALDAKRIPGVGASLTGRASNVHLGE